MQATLQALTDHCRRFQKDYFRRRYTVNLIYGGPSGPMYRKPPFQVRRYGIGRPSHRSVTEASAPASTWKDARSRTTALICCDETNIARGFNDDEPHRKSLNTFIEELHDDFGLMEPGSRHLFRPLNERDETAYLTPPISPLDLSAKPEQGPVNALTTDIPKTLEVGDGPPIRSASKSKSLDCLQSTVGHGKLRLSIPLHQNGQRYDVCSGQSLPRMRLKKATFPTQDVKPPLGADDGQSLVSCSWRATQRISRDYLMLDTQGP